MEKLNDYIYEIVDECTAPYKSMIDNLVIAIILTPTICWIVSMIINVLLSAAEYFGFLTLNPELSKTLHYIIAFSLVAALMNTMISFLVFHNTEKQI